MKHSNPLVVNLPMKLKKITSTFCLYEELISQKLLNFEFSRHCFLNLHPELLLSVFSIHNNRLFTEFLIQSPNWKIILSKSDEDSVEAQSITAKTNKINPSEIEIGSLGNSLFISAVHALIESPALLFSLMDQVDSKKYGQIYIIFINQNGTWRELFIDGVLPYKIERNNDQGSNRKLKKENKLNEKEKKSLLFSRLRNNGPNWLGLLEKAYGFAYGSYTKMLECLLEDMLYDLTGAPVDTLPIQMMSDFELGDLLLKNFNKGSPMLFIEDNLPSRLMSLYLGEKTLNQWGIPIIDLRNTNTEYIIVKIRVLKPFKKKKMTYSKGSNNWPPDLKTELGVKLDPDDVVWLSLAEIKELFANLLICNVGLQNFHKTIPCDFSDAEPLSYSICFLELKKNFNFGITICQEDLREFDFSMNYRYSHIRLFISKIVYEENCLTFVGATSGERRNVGLSCSLEKGNYLIYYEVEWSNKSMISAKKIRVNLYADFDCSLKILSPTPEFRKNMLSNIFASIANTQKLVKNPEIKPFFKKIDEEIYILSGFYRDFFYLVVKNKVLIKKIHKISVQIPIEGSYFTDTSLQLRNFIDKDIKLILPPNKDLILIFKVTKKLGDFPLISKPLKQIDNLPPKVQDYELKEFDISFLHPRDEEVTKSSFQYFLRSDYEFILFIKKFGSFKKRVVDSKEVEVKVWFGAFEEGISFLIENEMNEGIYYEKISYKVGNLEILKDEKQRKVTFGKDFVEVNLEKGRYALIKWLKINSGTEIYSYRFRNQFSVKSEKS